MELLKFLQGKNAMPDKIFIDSNIFIYTFLEGTKNNEKRLKSINFLEEISEKSIIISTQVLGEIFNVLGRRYNFKKDEIISKLEILSDTVNVKPLTLEIVKRCWNISKLGNYSYYDSLIIASALENKCAILYTEDMQNGQIIESLKIINPLY